VVHTRRVTALIVTLSCIFLVSNGCSAGEEDQEKGKGLLWAAVGAVIGLKDTHPWIFSMLVGFVAVGVLILGCHVVIKRVPLDDGTKSPVTFIKLIHRFFGVKGKGKTICNLVLAAIIFVLAFTVSKACIGEKKVFPAPVVKVPTAETGGPAPTERVIPGVIGLTEEKAYTELKESGFERAEVEMTRVESEKAEGIIVNQDPREGGTLAEGRVINLGVSRGRSLKSPVLNPRPGMKIVKGRVEVPGVTGLNWAAAERLLQSKGLKAKLVEKQENGIVPGKVIGQRPELGTFVERNATVTVDVCIGPKTCTNPDCIDVSLRPRTACPRCGSTYQWWEGP
jgi:hypothetical protein